MILTKIDKQATRVQTLYAKVLYSPNWLNRFLYRRSIDKYNYLIKARKWMFGSQRPKMDVWISNAKNSTLASRN